MTTIHGKNETQVHIGLCTRATAAVILENGPDYLLTLP